MLQRGLRTLTPDDRDFNLGSLVRFAPLSDLPPSYFVAPLSTKDQIADGFDDGCAAAAGTGMIEPKEEAVLFYPFLFAAAKYLSGDDPDSWGLELRDIGRALTKYGVPEYADVPEHIRTLDPSVLRRFETYPEEVLQAALKHRQKSYAFIKGQGEPFDLARQAMWFFRGKKQQIEIGVMWGWPLTDIILDGEPDGYGHALWMNGWNVEGITVVNSAGDNAGYGGTHTISRATFNAYAKKFGMLMLVDMEREEVEYMLQNNIKIGDNWITQLFKAFGKFIYRLWQ